jgi:hypothetical protein
MGVTPTVPTLTLTSCVTLSVEDGVHNEEDETESNNDDSVSNDSGDRDSDKDCVVIGGKETVISHEEVFNTSGKRAPTGGTQVQESSKTPKSTMTVEKQTFVQKVKSPPSISSLLSRVRLFLTPSNHWWKTHPTLSHLNVSLASSIQLSMPIRSRLTLTTYIYRYSLSLTISAIIHCLYMREP